MKRGGLRTFLRWFRILVSLGLLAGTLLLVHWNRNHDPRFWAFLETPPGRVLVRFLQWRGKVPDTNPMVRLDEEEERVRARLEKKVAATWPTARLTLKNGKSRIGHVVGADERSVTFAESWSGAGRIAVRIALAEIKSLEAYPDPPPAVSPRDAKFHLERPEFDLHRFPPYTIVTDEPFSSVVGYVRELELLERQIRSTFAGLITRTNRVDGIQVMVFSREEDYKGFQNKHAPLMENTAGFYAVMLDRLVLYNQAGSTAVKELRENVTSTAEQFRAGANGDQDYDRMLRQQERSMLQQIDRQSRQISTTCPAARGGASALPHAGHSLEFPRRERLADGGPRGVLRGGPPGGDPASTHAQLVLAAVRDGKNIPLVRTGQPPLGARPARLRRNPFPGRGPRLRTVLGAGALPAAHVAPPQVRGLSPPYPLSAKTCARWRSLRRWRFCFGSWRLDEESCSSRTCADTWPACDVFPPVVLAFPAAAPFCVDRRLPP
jgi:hypothetical protein